jgi:hypothetical protein
LLIKNWSKMDQPSCPFDYVTHKHVLQINIFVLVLEIRPN